MHCIFKRTYFQEEISRQKNPVQSTQPAGNSVVRQPPAHRLAGGGIAPEMLKDPNENERMERVKKLVSCSNHVLIFRNI